jgi:hypothetical protein
MVGLVGVRILVALALAESPFGDCDEAEFLSAQMEIVRACKVPQPRCDARTMKSRLDQLKNLIEQAFADVPYPGDGGIGSNPDDWESAELNEHFRGLHWKDIPRDVLQYHQHDLPSFSPVGLRYYLPTYLFAALEDFADTPDFTVYNVEPPTRPTSARTGRSVTIR